VNTQKGPLIVVVDTCTIDVWGSPHFTMYGRVAAICASVLVVCEHLLAFKLFYNDSDENFICRKSELAK
jgi:hypothetical protein